MKQIYLSIFYTAKIQHFSKSRNTFCLFYHILMRIVDLCQIHMQRAYIK